MAIRERAQAAVFVGAWLAALALTWAAVTATIPQPGSAPSRIHASLVVAAPAWTISYSSVTDNGSVFRLLREAGAVEGFELDWVEYGWPYHDVFVTSINGTRNDGTANLWWQYCLNGAYAARGAATQTLSDGDVVRWVYAPPGGEDLCR